MSDEDLDLIEYQMENFKESVWELAYDMHTEPPEFPKSEIKAILGLALRRTIDDMFKANFG